MRSSLSYLDELSWRGLLYQSTDGAAELLARGSVVGYCGFDPTAPSLHVGNLVPVMGLVHMQRAGHVPIAMVGGGTGLIGDPSGKSSERPLVAADAVEANTRALRGQLEHFLNFDGPGGARMRDNADWLLSLGALPFMRDVGKHFSINVMLARESVKSRLESGISYTEFSYMLLQAYDFLELHRRDGCALQIGGSDQWGNITAGTELIRRSLGAEAHGITLPLVTNADGKKFGKTESGSVWLDPKLTSPYQFYQFWINADDRDVGRYLRYFTLKPREEIEALERAVAERPESREGQQALAVDVTARIHGDHEMAIARSVSRILFDKSLDLREFSVETMERLSREIPFKGLALERSAGEPALSVLEALTETSLAKSRGDAKRLLQQGAVSVNGRRLAGEELQVGSGEAVRGEWFVFRKGARDLALVRVSQPS